MAHLPREWRTEEFQKNHPLDFLVTVCGFSFSTFQTLEGFSVLDSFLV